MVINYINNIDSNFFVFLFNLVVEGVELKDLFIGEWIDEFV